MSIHVNVNGAGARLYFQTKRFKHPWKLRYHTATCELVQPGDMQSSTQDIYGFRWKKWIRGSVGRLPRGSLPACGMKRSAKHLVKKKQNSSHRKGTGDAWKGRQQSKQGWTSVESFEQSFCSVTVQSKPRNHSRRDPSRCLSHTSQV